MAKRLFDICFAGGLLMLCSPALCIIALCIRATSKGPVLFMQTRVGKDGVHFTIYKFTTMHAHAPRELYRVEQNDDPLVIPFGRFLRRHHLDELPQLWNIFIGDMTFVGPRPTTPAIARMRTEEIPTFMERHKVLPGLTGLAQVHGRIWGGARHHYFAHRLNMFYIKHQSFLLDLRILLSTVRTVLKGKGV